VSLAGESPQALERKIMSASIHNWLVHDRIIGTGYVYKCKRCKHTTVSSEPLKSPYDKACVLTSSSKVGNI
jgi:hypothetical protein